MLCIDLFTDICYDWMAQYHAKQKNGPYGTYYTLEVANQRDKNKIKSRAKKSGIKYRIYDKKWERSSDYRSDFFKRNKGPFRCRYCNKKLKKNEVVVDHLIPVAKVKKSQFARDLLYIRGISTVNDYRNLVPACAKCNRKKSDQMGFWVIQGMLGRFKIYWILREVLIFISICFLVYLLWMCYTYDLLF